jgi:hypothetical protein
MGMSTLSARRKKQSSRTSARLRGTAQLGAAVALAVSGLGALAATAPARAATPSATAPVNEWRVAYSTHGGTSKMFTGITAPAKNDAWAVGETSPENVPTRTTPVFAHWNGKTWSSVTIKAAAGLDDPSGASAYSTSPGNVWFFGRNARTSAAEAVVYNGKGWHLRRLPSDFAIPLAVLGPKDVWGETLKSYLGETGDSTVLTHWNGSTWSAITIKGIAPAASSAGGHLWIMTVDALPVHVSGQAPSGPPLIYRTSGAALKEVGTPGQATITQDQSEIAAAPDGRLWILNQDGNVYSGSGTKWTSHAFPADAIATVVPTLSYDGKNGFWDGVCGHWTGSKWGADPQTRQLATFSPFAVAGLIPGTGSLWAAGSLPRTEKNGPLSGPTNAIIAVYGPLP